MSEKADWRRVVARPPVRWGLATIAAVFASLVVLAWILPAALRGTVERSLGEELGRTVHVERLGFNPLTLSASLEGLRVDGRGKEAPLLEVASLRVRLSLSSLWRRAVIIPALKLERPRLNLVRLADNRYNFSDIVDRLRAKPSSGASTRFALHNFELVDGFIAFDDKPLAQSHKVEALRIGIPVLSSIPTDIAVFVQPELSARIDGAAFALGGNARPFLAVPEAALAIRLAPVDLKPLVGYLPFKPAISLVEGKLATDLALRFHRAPGQPAALQLSGRIEALDWKLVGRDGEPLAGFGRFALDLKEFDPAAHKALINSVALERADLDVARDDQGRVRLQDEIEASLAGFAGERKPAAKAEKKDKDPVWSWKVEQIRLAAVSLHLADGSVSPAFAATLSVLDAELKGLSCDPAKPATLKLALGGDQGEAARAEARFTMAPFAWRGKIELKDIQPSRAAGYLNRVLPELLVEGGKVSASLPLKIATGADGFDFALDDARLSIESPELRRRADKAAFFSADSIELASLSADSAQRSVRLGSLKLVSPSLSVKRNARGEIDLASLLPADKTDKAGKASAKKASAAPWRFALGEASVEAGSLRMEDQSRKPALKLALHPLALTVRDFVSDGHAPMDIALKTGWNKGGQLALQGKLTPQPLVARFAVDGKRLDIVPLIAQATERYDEISVTRARLDAHGDLAIDLSRVGKPKVSYKGQLGVSDFASIDLINDTDFVRWRQFALSRIDAKLNPTSLAVGDVVLSGLQTRLILDSQGRLNLREVTREQDGEALVAPPVKAAPGALSASAKPGVTVAPAPVLPPIRIGRIRLSGADIRYSDRFVKPNFDANLLGVQGTLSGLASDTREIAKLQLTGSVDGSAPLAIDGELAPFRNDRYLDLKASVKGYEMSALSAYSGKYVGYGIEKGKLSMDLGYQIVDRKLTARNRVFLDQLTLGDKVDSPDATKLPVKFALSLLKNRRGEIDVNLPVSGTLDDPQFSVGGIIWKMIGNFFAKIVTAPFSFLSGEDGDAELSSVPFAAGTQRLGPEALKRVETVAKALLDRPALALELTGRADPKVDLDGLRRESLQRKLRTEKLRLMAKEGESGGSIDEITISANEYPELLERVYKGEKFEGKPRNLLGLAKSLPVAEMERLLIAHAPVKEAEVRALAQGRASIVKNALLEKGVPPEQLFVLSPKLGAEPDKAGASALQVDLSLR
ncbi:DUF748 domain-containing protein [Niveibacterium terrae]|uniref:DUF748 domain-containing protein n=1 Tax=Niveibacterium terrae TaxID=3373598 RepID=UPI003A918DA3